MNHSHPENTVAKRSVAFLWGLFGSGFFVVGTVLVAGFALLLSWLDRDEGYPEQIAAARAAKLAEVVESQESLLGGEASIEKAILAASRKLGGTKPKASQVAVPGTPEALAQMEAQMQEQQQQQQQQAPAEAPAPAPAEGGAAAGGEKTGQ